MTEQYTYYSGHFKYSEDVSSCISPPKMWDVFIVFSDCILTYTSKR